MDSSWVWWILTCVIALYFVALLIDFNKPSRILMEHIDNQDVRRREMEQKLKRVQDEMELAKTRQDDLDLEMEELEQRRKDLLPEANKKEMVAIEEGQFSMGGREEDSPDNERPTHPVHLSYYYIGNTPVTNQEYREFVNCTGYKAPIHWQRGTYPTGLAKHPVVNVSYHDAKAYANWKEARLPTEAEWEKAARGNDERLYPWGNRFVDGERCNSNNMVGTTLPVDEFPLGRSPFGCWDMSGNVYEWCEDYYEAGYYDFSPVANPKGPAGGQERVIRGGYFSETRPNVRTTHRSSAAETHTRENVGFRLAIDGDGTNKLNKPNEPDEPDSQDTEE